MASHDHEKLSEGLSGERNATMNAQTAGGLRIHGFREHKSPAIYAFSV
jgi:hypothetical protein